jgi:hypothetical protein
MILVYNKVLFFEICGTQPCENKFVSNYIHIRVASIRSKKRLLFSYLTCVLSRIRYNRYMLKDRCQQTLYKILYVHVMVHRHAKNRVLASWKTLHVQIYASAKG